MAIRAWRTHKLILIRETPKMAAGSKTKNKFHIIYHFQLIVLMFRFLFLWVVDGFDSFKLNLN
jgi:hypothetical protein